MSVANPIMHRNFKDIDNIQNASWRNDTWTAADIGALVVDAAGRVLQFVGDTYTNGQVDPGNPTDWYSSDFTSNSLLWSYGGLHGARFSTGRNIFGAPNPYMKSWYALDAEGVLIGGFHWPSCAWIDSLNKVRVIYQRYKGNLLSFVPYEAREVTIGNNLEILSTGSLSQLFPVQIGGQGVSWGTSVVSYEGYAYYYGIINYYSAPYNWKRGVLQRRSLRYGSLAPITFWNGTSWGLDVQLVDTIRDNLGDPLDLSSQYYVGPWPHGGFMMLVYPRGILGDGTIHLLLSPAPIGPWTDMGSVFTTPFEFVGQYAYGPYGFWNDNKFWMAYNLNGNNDNYLNYGLRWTELDLLGGL